MGLPTLRLEKWQRNQIFEAIEAAGLFPSDFDLAADAAEVRIKHKWSASYFIIGGGPGHYVGSHVVGDAAAWPYEAYSWQAMISGVSRWLVDVKRDLETPDLWAELQRDAQLLGDASDEATENTPFTPDEQKEIAMRLQGMAEQARHTYSLSEEQMRVLNAKIDYLKAAAGRLGRIHWRDVFLGVMFTFVLASALPPESVRHIVLTVLRTIVQHHGFPELPNG